MTRIAMGKHVDIQERPYHHGDLRRAIVRAALEILSETQSVDFSLRELVTTRLTSILPRSASCWRLSRQLDSNC
jgi:hypothetical protein